MNQVLQARRDQERDKEVLRARRYEGATKRCCWVWVMIIVLETNALFILLGVGEVLVHWMNYL